MNAQEKKLLEAFLNQNDVRQHGRAVELLFYGRTVKDASGREIHTEFDVTRAIRNAVSICFSGPLYSGRRREVYDTFVSLFTDYLLRKPRETFDEIEDLQNWMFLVARNFANGHRKAMHEILAIDEASVPFDRKQDVTEPEDSGREDEARPDVDEDRQPAKVPDEDDDSSDDSSDDPEHSSKWVEDLIGEYICRIPHAYYREILYVLHVYGMSMEDYAEEKGKKLSAIHNDHKRAMSALIQAALPDIRWRSPKLYDSYRDFLDSDETEVLDCFFEDGDAEDMAGLVKAYVKLLKVSKREAKVMEKAEKKEERERRKAAKEKKSKQ